MIEGTDERAKAVDPEATIRRSNPAVPSGSHAGRTTGAPRTDRRKVWYVGIAVVILIGGIGLSVVAEATPEYTSSLLPDSGSFYALAEAGNTLYAASDNGGSILLERSTDQGGSWTASPVPYSAVAGGAPWTYAVVAADGSDIIMAASTGSPSEYVSAVPPSDPVNSGVTPELTNGTCSESSTILLAASGNGGASWQSRTFSTPGLVVTSLQANLVGDLAAVAWLAESTACFANNETAQSVTSSDAGASWSTVQAISPADAAIPDGEALEMAPGVGGLDLAFVADPSNGTPPELTIWNFTGGDGPTFAPMLLLVAPSSWTLQGQPDAGAFLLTPSYLIPLTSGSITALPFDQLASDDSDLGSLPDVVSLVSTSPGTVVIAATTSNDLGVDCWQVTLATGSVAETCHVPLDSFLGSSSGALPIVALLDGGNFWTAIGASSGGGCAGPVECGGGTSSGGSSGDVPVAAPSSVGTSVCAAGCTSTAGLVSYSYTMSSAGYQETLTVLGIALAVAGVVGLIVAVWNDRREGRSAPGADAPSAEARAARSYRYALVAWAAAWSPLAVLALIPGGSAQTTLFLALIAVGLLGGAAASAPFVTRVRRELASSTGFSTSAWMDGSISAPPGSPLDRMRWTSAFAYASWLAAFGILVVLIADLAGAVSADGFTSVGAPIVVLVVSFAVLRILYHHGLARLTAVEMDGNRVGASAAQGFRSAAGAALLPWNPFVGLLIGVAVASGGAGDPFLFAWAFLPVTLLGIALSCGAFGPTLWSAPVARSRPAPAIGA